MVVVVGFLGVLFAAVGLFKPRSDSTTSLPSGKTPVVCAHCRNKSLQGMPTAKLAKELSRAQAGFSLDSGTSEIRQALQAQYALAASLHSRAYPFFANRIEVDSKKHISLEQIWGQLNVLLAPVLAKVSENIAAYEARTADGAGDNPKAVADAGVPRKRERNEPFPEGNAGGGDSDADEQTIETPKRRGAPTDKDKDAWRYAFGRGQDDEEDEEDVDLDEEGADDGNDEDFEAGSNEFGADADNGDVASATGSGDEEEGEDDEEDEDDDRAALKELYGSDFSDDDARVGEFPDEEDEEDDEEDFELDDVEREAAKALGRRGGGNGGEDDDDSHNGHVDGHDDILNDVANEFGDQEERHGGELQEDGDADDPNLTRYQAEREREKRRIAQMEEERLYGANWAMGGEVGASARPKDSLITETLDFEHTMKPVPVNTEHTTAQLEERIKRRILEKRFDDVERRRVRSTADDLVQTKTDTSIDAEKSKFSLMDLYEKEFLEKMKRAEESGPDGAVETAEPLTEIEKDELRAVQLWKRLSQHLDALSNFFYTPKPAKQDLDARVRAVENQAPAIRVENVGNFAISRENALAPQDLFRPSNRAKAGVSVDEMDPKEKRGLRRAKKESYASTKERKQRQLEKRQGPQRKESDGHPASATDKAATKPRKVTTTNE